MNRYKNYIMLSVATLSAIIMRIVMSLFITEADSGFIKGENLGVAIFIIVVLVLAAVATCYFGAIGETGQRGKPSFKGKVPSVISLVLGCAMIVSAFMPSMLPNWQKGLEAVLALAFGFYLVFYALESVVKIKLPEILWVVAVVYWLVKLVNIFTTYSALSNTFDNLFEIFTLCSVLFFFLSLSKGFCLEPSEKNIKILNVAAYIACFMSFSCSVPKAIIVLTNNQSILGDNKSFTILLLTGVYILSFILSNTKKQ